MASNIFGKKRYSWTKYNIKIETDNTLIFPTDMGPSKNKELKYLVYNTRKHIAAEYRGAIQKATLYLNINMKIIINDRNI